MPVNTNDLRDMASEFRETSFTAMVIEAANQLDSTRTERNILRAELTAAREELREVKVSSRHPEVIRWRNDGIEACAQIADRYQCEYAAQDMRALLTRAQGESS